MEFAQLCAPPAPRTRRLRDGLVADLAVSGVDEDLHRWLLGGEQTEMPQSRIQGRVVVEQLCTVAALPPTLHRLDGTEEPRHEAIVGTQLEPQKCRRSLIEEHVAEASERPTEGLISPLHAGPVSSRSNRLRASKGTVMCSGSGIGSTRQAKSCSPADRERGNIVAAGVVADCGDQLL
jgi:hypothetical protein